MKKIFYLICVSTALSIISCQKNEIAPEMSSADGLVFSSEKPVLIDETKTAWTGSTIQWSKGDQIRVAYTCDDIWQNADGSATDSEESGSKTAKAYISTSLEEDAAIAQFKVPGDFTGTAEGVYKFYGAYPASACTDGANFKYAPSLTVTIPTTQTPATNSFDSSADIMLGESVSTFTGIPTEPVSMEWDRLVAHAQITFKTLKDFTDGETISSIVLTADSEADMVGTHYIKLDSKEVTKSGSAVANILTLNGTNIIADEYGTFVAWASFLPCTIKSLKVVITTDKATYTRDIASCDLTFKKNARNILGVDMSSAERAELAPQPDYSGEWLIGGVNETTYYVAKKYESGNNLKTIEILFSDSKVTYADGIEECKMVLNKITEGTYAGMYTIEDASSTELTKSYLYVAGSSSNKYLKAQNTLNENSYWTITANEDNTYKIIADKSDISNNIIRFNYNNGSPLFSCYASTSTLPAITLIPYSAVQPDTRTTLETPTVTAELNDDDENVTNSIDVSWNAIENAGTYEVTATPTEGTAKTVTVDAPATSVTIKELLWNTEYTISVVAKPSDKSLYLDSVAGTSSSLTTGDKPEGVEEKEYTLTIAPADFTTGSYGENNGEHTSTAKALDESSVEVKWFSNQVYQNSSAMQWQKSNGYIYNTTDLGTIISVTVNSTEGSFTTYYGTAQAPTENTTVTGGYFNVKVGSATGKTNSIVIIFKK